MCKIILSILAISFAFAQVASESCGVVGELKADKRDCGIFYQCTNQGWVELVCQSGLYFNPKISVCDWPSNVICNPENDDDDDQPKLEPCDDIGQLKADAEKCDAYQQCTEKGWEVKSCESPLSFNPNSSSCDENFTCGEDAEDNNNDNNDSADTNNVNNHSADADNDINDSGDTDNDGNSKESHNDDHNSEDGDDDDSSDPESCGVVGELKADKRDCGIFYQCTNQGWVELVCRSGLYFNPKISVCDWPSNVICNPENDDDDDQPKLEPCDDIGQLKADAEKCDAYQQCTEKGWEVKSCESPLSFNPNSSSCDENFTCGEDAEDNNNDNNDSADTNNVNNHSADADNDINDSGDTDNDGNSKESHNDDHNSEDGDDDDSSDPESCGVVGELKADKRDCGIFYQCTNEGWVELVCRSGLYFNPKISVCDWPSNVICNPENDDDDDQPKLEPCDDIGQLKADAEKCDAYQQCTEKGWEVKSCESPLSFNPNSSSCDENFTCGEDAEDNNNDNNDSADTNNVNNHSADADNDNNDSGDTDNDGNSKESHNDDHNSEDGDDDDQSAPESCGVVGELKADKRDCGIFYQCTNQGWVELVCQSGLYFNPKIAVCDWPSNVICNPENDDDDDQPKRFGTYPEGSLGRVQ